MKYLDMVFIAIAKLYIKFYEEKDDEWFYFPLMMITLCITLFVMSVSFFFIDIAFFYYLILIFLTAFLLHFRFEKISYEDVKNSNLTIKNRVIIYLFLILELSVSFFLMYLSRINYFE